MNKRYFTRSLLFTLAALALSAQVSYANDPKDAEAEASMEASQSARPLVAAGIDPHSESELIASLGSTDLTIQLAAIDLIKRNRSRKAFAPLRKLLVSPQPLVRLATCDTLEALHEDKSIWMPTCVELLRNTDDGIQAQAAGVLAEGGNSQGWNVIRTMLFSNNEIPVYLAATTLPAFQGLSVEAGGATTHLQVLAVCYEAFRLGNAKTQQALFGPIVKLAKKEDVAQVSSLMGAAKTQTIKTNLSGVVKYLSQKAG